MSFERVSLDGGSGLYQWQPNTGADATGGWAGYLLTTGADSLPAITAQSAWEDHWGNPAGNVNGGIYVFAPEAPANPGAFLAQLLDQVRDLNRAAGNFAYRYLLWVTGAAPPAGAAINFARGGDGQRGTVQQTCQLVFRNIKLEIAVGVDVLCDYSTPSFSLRPFGAATLQFVNTVGLPQRFGQVAGRAVLELGGPAPGRMGMMVQARAPISAGDNDLRKMRTGVQYFFLGKSGDLVGQLYPVLNKTASPFFLDVRLDPLHPQDRDRTRFTFANTPGGTPPPRFESYLTTDGGHTVWLTPVAGDAGYVLQEELYPRSLLQGQAQTPTYYLTPTGRFVLSADPVAGAAPGTAQMLCGLAGVETIAFDSPTEDYQGDILRFHPDQPAYAPVFPLPAVNLRQPDSPLVSPHLLRDDYRTAWATINRGTIKSSGTGPTTPNGYYSQPDGAPFYTGGQAPGNRPAATTGPPLLDFYPALLANLTGDTAADSFPLVPYRGPFQDGSAPALTPEQMAGYESQLISPTRKQQVVAIKARAGAFARPEAGAGASSAAGEGAGTGTCRITTPQGLLATVPLTPGARWEQLLLARNAVDGTVYELAFANLDPVLQDAVQTNQQFLVVTRLDGLTDTTFQNVIRIAGWPFQIEVGKGNTLGDYRNVLIFKFIRGKLSELIRNPSNWTSADAFNATGGQGLAFLSQWLQDYIAEAREMAAAEQRQGVQNSYFQHFLDIVDSETWNGILALKVDIELSQFPPVLKGLLGGIDLTRFHAHHFGAEVSFVQATPDGTTDPCAAIGITGNSSLFGLVYYVDAAYQAQVALGGSPDRPVPAAAGDYDFKVLTLKVLFENTAIKSFDSTLQLTVNRWFGEQVRSVVAPDGTPVDLPSPAILLTGAYEEHDGEAVFTFSSRSDRLFRLSSNVLGVVEALQTQFATLADRGGPSGDQVQCRFTLTCLLNFLPAAGFDLFSFGSDWAGDRPGSRQGLYASNLYIDMEFPAATPTQRTFAFNPTAMAFNLDQSRARPGSLYRNFPVKLVGLIAGTADQGPDKAGYLRVSLDGPAFTGLREAWNGLVLQLDLGTVGALAENAGLTAQLLAAWSPGSGGTRDKYDVQVGLKLPGTGGDDRLFSLQGVLKLAVDDIQLLQGTTRDGRPAYLMKLTQIGLKFLGIKLPFSGNTVFFLFGAPNPGAPQNSLGWYAAYNKEK